MNRIYLIKSKSSFLLNKKIEELTSGINEIEYYSLNDSDITDVIESLSYYGLFTEEKVVVVKDTKYFGGKFNYEDDMNKIINFLKENDNIFLIFVCDELLKSKKNTTELVKLGANIINDDELDNLTIIKEYTTSINVNIDDVCINKILSNTENNIDMCLNEIDKLSNVSNNITMDIINTYGIVQENNDVAFDFSNAVVAKKMDVAFKLLDNLLLSDPSGISITGILASQFINMYMVRDADTYNLSDEDISSSLGFNNPKRVYMLRKNSKIYTKDDLSEIIINLCELDKKIKSGYKVEYIIKEFLLNL